MTEIVKYNQSWLKPWQYAMGVFPAAPAMFAIIRMLGFKIGNISKIEFRRMEALQILTYTTLFLIFWKFWFLVLAALVSTEILISTYRFLEEDKNAK